MKIKNGYYFYALKTKLYFMKKFIPIAVIAVLGTLSIVSCKKSSSDPVGNYTCFCTYTSSGNTDTASLPINNQKKSTAQSACNTEQTQLNTNSNGMFTNVTCTLK